METKPQSQEDFDAMFATMTAGTEMPQADCSNPDLLAEDMSAADIDAAVANLAAELNSVDATGAGSEALSQADQDFLADNGITARAMTAEELKAVAANEAHARAAVAMAEFITMSFILNDMEDGPLESSKQTAKIKATRTKHRALAAV
jgi:hypothetical protein